jgi:hypothetical protein
LQLPVAIVPPQRFFASSNEIVLLLVNLLLSTLRMATTSVHPNTSAQELRYEPHAKETGSALVTSGGAESAIVREHEGIDRDSVVCRMPVEVEVGVPVRDFRVRNLLALNAGTIVHSQWNHGEDLPLAAGHVQLAWIEFEVLDSVLAARITRPA